MFASGPTTCSREIRDVVRAFISDSGGVYTPSNTHTICSLDCAFNPAEIIVVVIDALGRGELVAREVCSLIAAAGAFGASFVQACTWEGTGFCETAWAAVLVFADIAKKIIMSYRLSFS